MSGTLPFPAELSQRILQRFGIAGDPPPNLETLRQLLQRYTRMVPWESASRIVRRAQHDKASDCVNLGSGFWESHFDLGTGGTCYESNYAFLGLLQWIGFEGYLTINNMGKAIGCHSAIVLLIGGGKVLVDVGLPIYAVLPLDAMRETSIESDYLQYKVEPQGSNRFMIWRKPHPRSNAFLLVDEPVSDTDYRAIAIHDYRVDGGQFLNEIVINKVVDEQLWRFNSDERPLRMQQFVDGQRQDHLFGEDAADEVAEKFGLARDVVARAMEVLGIVGNCTKMATH